MSTGKSDTSDSSIGGGVSGPMPWAGGLKQEHEEIIRVLVVLSGVRVLIILVLCITNHIMHSFGDLQGCPTSGAWYLPSSANQSAEPQLLLWISVYLLYQLLYSRTGWR